MAKSSKQSIEENLMFSPLNQSEWRDWLSSNHQHSSGIWLKMFKKSSKRYNLSWSEAVDEALCFSWIDSTKRPIDNECYIQYFGPRKPTSSWSKINKEKVASLIAGNKMTEAGLKSIETAKSNGSWNILDSVELLEIPKDLEVAFRKNKGSFEYFDSLSKSYRKSALTWILFAKRPETRLSRIESLVEACTSHQKLTKF